MARTEKFDEVDRGAVIRAVQKQQGVQLSQMGRRRKWLRDQKGRTYWVLGGYDAWHGIPEEMMAAAIQEKGAGVLVIAMRERTEMRIYLGPLDPLVRNRHRLARASRSGDYQFTLTKRAGRLHITQVPDCALTEMTTVHYAPSVVTRKHGRRTFASALTREEIAALMADERSG